MIRKIIGWSIISAFFGSLFYIGSLSHGAAFMLTAFCGSIAVTAAIYMAVCFIVD